MVVRFEEQCMIFDGEQNVKVLTFGMFQLSQSNQSQVFLRNVSAGLAGSIKCEVTADSTFTSAVKQTELVVVGELSSSITACWFSKSTPKESP